MLNVKFYLRVSGYKVPGFHPALRLRSVTGWNPGTLEPETQLFQRLLKQLENPLVLIRPAAWLNKPVILHGENGQIPFVFLQFNQPLRQTHNILEMHVHIYHPVQHQQVTFQPFCKIDW